MEEAVAEVTLTPEVVAERVRQLNGLFDEIESRFKPALDWALDAQTPDTWTAIPACAEFRHTMRASLDRASVTLAGLWTRVQELCETLRANAEALQGLDESTQDGLTRLLARADAGPQAQEPLPPGVRPPFLARPDVDPLFGPYLPTTTPAPAGDVTASAPAGGGGGSSW